MRYARSRSRPWSRSISAASTVQILVYDYRRRMSGRRPVASRATNQRCPRERSSRPRQWPTPPRDYSVAGCTETGAVANLTDHVRSRLRPSSPHSASLQDAAVSTARWCSTCSSPSGEPNPARVGPTTPKRTGPHHPTCPFSPVFTSSRTASACRRSGRWGRGVRVKLSRPKPTD